MVQSEPAKCSALCRAVCAWTSYNSFEAVYSFKTPLSLSSITTCKSFTREDPYLNQLASHRLATRNGACWVELSYVSRVCPCIDVCTGICNAPSMFPACLNLPRFFMTLPTSCVVSRPLEWNVQARLRCRPYMKAEDY